jgi:hypothetical protein
MFVIKFVEIGTVCYPILPIYGFHLCHVTSKKVRKGEKRKKLK